MPAQATGATRYVTLPQQTTKDGRSKKKGTVPIKEKPKTRLAFFRPFNRIPPHWDRVKLLQLKDELLKLALFQSVCYLCDVIGRGERYGYKHHKLKTPLFRLRDWIGKTSTSEMPSLTRHTTLPSHTPQNNDDDDMVRRSIWTGLPVTRDGVLLEQPKNGRAARMSARDALQMKGQGIHWHLASSSPLAKRGLGYSLSLIAYVFVWQIPAILELGANESAGNRKDETSNIDGVAHLQCLESDREYWAPGSAPSDNLRGLLSYTPRVEKGFVYVRHEEMHMPPMLDSEAAVIEAVNFPRDTSLIWGSGK
ncbi:hypothetical protein EDB87DRAFT_1582004 [Lactarius vividus]|nr:hypothetical protein EDB87DRAFT_1582004 [Lactarius vividus]